MLLLIIDLTLIRKSFLILKSCANYSKYDSKQPKMTLFD